MAPLCYVGPRNGWHGLQREQVSLQQFKYCSFFLTSVSEWITCRAIGHVVLVCRPESYTANIGLSTHGEDAVWTVCTPELHCAIGDEREGGREGGREKGREGGREGGRKGEEGGRERREEGRGGEQETIEREERE